MAAILIYIIAGLGAGIGTGLAGLSAAAVISPMLIAFLDFPAYEAVGIALASDVLASAVSSYTYAKNKNIDIKNGIIMMCAVLLFTLAAADGKLACALFSAAAFSLLAALGGCIHWVPLQNACALLSKYSYAVFLTHHVIILRLVDNFDLAAMTRRDTALLFGVYLLAVAAASAALFRLDAWVRSSAVKLAAKPE